MRGKFLQTRSVCNQPKVYLSSSELDFSISQVGKAQTYVCNGVGSLIGLRLQSFVLIIMHLTFSYVKTTLDQSYHKQ